MQGSEIIIILLLALIVLGPEKLPGAIRQFTKFYAEARKMSTGFQSELRNALDEPMRELRDTAELVRKNADVRELTKEPTKPNATTSKRTTPTRKEPTITSAPVAGGARVLPAVAPEVQSEPPPAAGWAPPGSSTPAPAPFDPPTGPASLPPEDNTG